MEEWKGGRVGGWEGWVVWGYDGFWGGRLPCRPFCERRLYPMLRREPSGFHGALEGLMVGFRLVSIGTRKTRKCPVDNVTLSEVAGQHSSTSRAGVPLGKQSAANSAVIHERGTVHTFDRDGPFHVAELADIVVTVVHGAPTQQRVAH